MKTRKGVSPTIMLVVVIAGLLLVTGVIGPGLDLQGVLSAAQGDAQPAVDKAACGDDASCTVTVNVANPLNESGTETADMTLYIKGDDGAVNSQNSDTTDGSYTLTPGTYEFCVVSSSTKNAKVVSTSRGTVNDRGCADVPVESENLDLQLDVSDHGGLEAKVFDNNKNKFLNVSTGSGSPGDFEADGTTFDNDGTAIAVGSGGDFSYTMTVRQDTSDEEFSDMQAYIGVVADTAKYDEPVVKWDGSRLTDQGTSVLTEEGQKAVGSTYDYVYEVPETFNDVTAPAQVKHEIDFDGSAISGVNPGASDDIQIDFLADGRYERVATNNDLAVSTHKDDSSFTVIHTIMDFTIDHS